MPLKLDSAAGSITFTAEDGVGNVNLVVPRVGFQVADADIPTVSATQVEMEAGIETTNRAMSPARVAQAIISLAAGGAAVPVTSSQTLQIKKTYMIISATALTLTLPASPTLGDQVGVWDGASVTGSVVHTIARNGKNIQGLAQDLILDVPGFQVTLWYNGTEWRLI
jgi:hypothetical protein